MPDVRGESSAGPQTLVRAANLPTAVDFPFAHRQRVRFGETDLQGVVYYANYLLFAEVGRVAYLRQLGFVYERDLLARGVDFTIGEARVRYHAPLRFDEEYDIKVRVGEIRHSSWAFEYAIDRADGMHCADATTIQVMLDRASLRPTRIPEELRAVLQNAKPSGAA
jgi:acyl-CoA thioester hydrolase